MRVSKRQLKKIIREETQVLQEQAYRNDLREVVKQVLVKMIGPNSGVYDSDNLRM